MKREPDRVLRLQRISVSGFKAVDKFTMRVDPELTVLLGMNGTGKSSILQMFSFVRHLAQGKPSLFFEERGWSAADIRFKRLHSRSNFIDIEAYFLANLNDEIRWRIKWDATAGRLRSERVDLRLAEDDDWVTQLSFKAKGGGRARGQGIPPLTFEGSILGVVQIDDLDEDERDPLVDLYQWLSGIESLELLSPAAMKAGTGASTGNLGSRGDRLAGFLAGLTTEQRVRVQGRVALFYPLADLDTVRKKSGWIDLVLAEAYRGMGKIQSGHMSDGFMRVLAFCAIPEMRDVSMILLDEVEDGIQPHILGPLIELMSAETPAQIIATTHSPLLANVVGTSKLRLLTRSTEGRTIATAVERLPVFQMGNEFFGPGELWANTELSVIEDQARRIGSLETDEAKERWR